MTATRIAGEAVEAERLAALRGYEILDTPAESDFDDIAVLAAQLCDKPTAMVSLVDAERQWFKARVGTDICEGHRADSFCTIAMHELDVMQVPDAHLDPRFAASPMVTGEPHIRFYAGAPLVTPVGQRLGTLCVVDRVPGVLTQPQKDGLRALARHVVTQLELRKYARDMHALNQRLRDAERIKDEFIARVNHELRTPLSSIHGYLEMLGDPDLGPDARENFLARVRRNSDRLLSLVDDMLLAAQVSTENQYFDRTPADLVELVHAAAGANRPIAEAKGLTLTTAIDGPVHADIDRRRIGQALDRLILNAVKFTESGHVTVSAVRRGDRAILEVTDTGIGISPADQERVLEPFRRAADAERAEVQGLGLGLTIVKAIAEGHDGRVSIVSVSGQGSTVGIELPLTGPYPETDA
ncbi:GAF domain-containing sensor histidine kinase [Actinoplanes sp. NPDC051851]|uniref:GAF domain-containing sensor histidine kinase n=1 Tax=Actinoplanes sp. NPDC051851 TaxID=3154753 RepID=UPI00342EE7CD